MQHVILLFDAHQRLLFDLQATRQVQTGPGRQHVLMVDERGRSGSSGRGTKRRLGLYGRFGEPIELF